MQKLQTQRWGGKTQAILRQARRALLESNQQEVRDLVVQLPEDPATNQYAPISLAFAGQYSAGKSTILKALTGRQDIATGAGITTEQTQTLDWNGVKVIDTPGIHTAIRPDHDDIAYGAISQADLLVFVITNELFDDHLGNHFRKLAVDREKGHETILVVNKMGRTADGNTPETREVIVEDLRKPLAPFTPEGLRTTFTDAESALEAGEEEEKDLAEMLRRQANMEELIRNLDGLIQDKGLGARHTTILYTIDQVMHDAIASEPTEDPDVDSLVMIYNQNMRVIRETRSHLQRSIRNAIDEAVTQVILAGAEYADSFHPNSSQEQLDEANSAVDIKIERIWNSLIQRIEDDFTEAIPVMGDRLDELRESHRFRTTMATLNSRKPGPDTQRILTIAQTAAARLGEFGRRASMSPRPRLWGKRAGEVLRQPGTPRGPASGPHGGPLLQALGSRQDGPEHRPRQCRPERTGHSPGHRGADQVGAGRGEEGRRGHQGPAENTGPLRTDCRQDRGRGPANRRPAHQGAPHRSAGRDATLRRRPEPCTKGAEPALGTLVGSQQASQGSDSGNSRAGGLITEA